jgi:two-component system cell cycle sensor histidine kinase/response regulator CckA
MPTGGEISIALANATLELKDVVHHDDVRPGEYVSLIVADNGCGMDAATQARAFEPFFTTKGVDKGTGLGLATVYGIVRRCRGVVQLQSAPGEGTRFTILLPRAAVGIAPRVVQAPVPPDARGVEKILVVEDEDPLRRLIQRVLEVHGYTVVSADQGIAALDLLKSGQSFDLLLTDIMMPGMNGRALASEARRMFPELPLLYMSGFHELEDSCGSQDDARLLSKPFSSDVLTRAVRAALDGVRS